jgi:ATP-dependent DNA helicase RecG
LPYPLFHPRSRRQPPFSVSLHEFQQEFPAEGSLVEFKSGTAGRALQDSVVAFSNGDGGVVLLGVADDGIPSGRPLDAGTEDAIHEALASASDLGRYEIQGVDVAGRGITVLSVAKREEGFAQTSNGRVLVRRGSRDDPLFGADLQRFINERAQSRFETTITEIPIEGADAMPRARLAEAFGWADGALAERLEETGLAREGRLTVAGALYLLSDPAVRLGKAYIEILRYPDDSGMDYDRREEIRGPLDVQVRETVDRLTRDLGRELVVLGTRRYELPRIPEVVLRESIANAVAHRSYELTGAATRVEIRPGAIRIISPGGLPEPVTVRNIRDTNSARNLDVIRTLRRLGLAEDVGRGVDVMQDVMRSEMLNPPVFIDHGHVFEVSLPVRSAVAPIERAWVRELESRGELEGDDRLVLVHAARGDGLTNARVRGILQTDAQRARLVLQRLRDRELLTQHGNRGGATYTLVGSLRPPAGLRLTAAELDSLVEALAERGPITNADVREATGLDRVAALRVLDRLVVAGRLARRGERRGTRYVAVETVA